MIALENGMWSAMAIKEKGKCPNGGRSQYRSHIGPFNKIKMHHMIIPQVYFWPLKDSDTAPKNGLKIWEFHSNEWENLR